MPEAAAIPIIDISAEGVDELDIAKALVDAAATYGFVYIRNTGKDIPAAQVQSAFDISRKLFLETSIEEKQKCSIQKNNRGWSGMHTETLDPKTQRVGDFKEAFNFGPFPDGKPDQPLPSTLEEEQVATVAAFRASCSALCQRILWLFGVGLAADPPSFFTASHSDQRPSGTILRLLYYPPPGDAATSSARADDVRAGAHSDYGSITLLFRLAGQAGLEVLTPENVWAPVPVVPPGTEGDAAPPVLVNIGDLLSYWTNGLLRSTVHRVTGFEGGANGAGGNGVSGESSTGPRYSIAFFCHPANDTKLEPVPSARVRESAGSLDSAKEGNPYAERKVLTATEHLQMRLEASYAKLYEKKD